MHLQFFGNPSQYADEKRGFLVKVLFGVPIQEIVPGLWQYGRYPATLFGEISSKRTSGPEQLSESQRIRLEL
jgi:hypothetical protein